MTFKLALLALVALILVGQIEITSAQKVCAYPGANSFPGESEGMPGGWTRMTRDDIASAKALKANAKAEATKLAKEQGAKCKASGVAILKACQQIVAGVQYEYVARTTIKCPGEAAKREFFENKFVWQNW